MKKAMRKVVSVISAATLLFCNSLTAFAEVSLPEGSVAGLPEKLTVLDSSGESVNEKGEYFFIVEDMIPHVEYSKDIQIINLREDKAYHIYFYAEPISRKGEIDLENDCQAAFTLDGEEIFDGKVTGEPKNGGKNLADEPIDLGLYKPGNERKLNCTITWNGESAEKFVDYGSKVVDTEGTHVIREKSGDNYIYGETEFRWVFYAAVDEEYTPPNTGVLSSEISRTLIILSSFILLAVIIFGVLVVRKQLKKSQE